MVKGNQRQTLMYESTSISMATITNIIKWLMVGVIWDFQECSTPCSTCINVGRNAGMESNCYYPVQDTNDSSTLSKGSISRKGYYVDGFIENFTSQRKTNRSPLINRGYYVRCKAISQVIATFIHGSTSDGQRQIISLGAGYDTTYFRLYAEGLIRNLKYFEIDFPRIICTKIKKIINCSQLFDCLENANFGETFLDSNNYAAIGCDLQNLELVQKLLLKSEVDFTVPTLLLSECVLTYINPRSVDAILQWSSSMFRTAMFCTYEQVYPDDGFGMVMQEHFHKLSSQLKNINMYKTPKAQEDRFLKLGWNYCKSFLLRDFYHCLPESEKARVESLEVFDEFEEFELKCSHYTILVAVSTELLHILDKIQKEIDQRKLCSPPKSEYSLQPLASSVDSVSISRYGHSSVKVSDDTIICFGGFGIDERCCHKRLDDVLVITVKQDSCTVKKMATTGSGPGPIMHHRTVLLRENSILLVGGRKSPFSPNNVLYVLNVMADCGEWKIMEPDDTSAEMKPRWRHSATKYKLHDSWCVIVFGGLSYSNQTLSDGFIIHTSLDKWKIEKIPISLPESRHSHCTISVNSGLIITGGLTQNMNPAQSTVLVRKCEEGWSMSTIKLNSLISSRFGMTCCYNSNNTKVHIFGGIEYSGFKTLVEIDLETLSLTAFSHKQVHDEFNIPINCTMHFIDNILCVVGGGGNCFSFGTFYNISCLKLKKMF